MSAILSADDLNDFISPGVACIKPVETLPVTAPPQTDQSLEFEVILDGPQAQAGAAAPAQISLTDCLACSGCVTSAEAVLVSLQSHSEVLHALDAGPALRLVGPDSSGRYAVDGLEDESRLLYVASVSPQTRASLAAACGRGVTEKEAGYMIERLLRGEDGLRAGGKWGNGFTWVVDTNAALEACLALGSDEVFESVENGRSATSRPILTSSCPGWVCYAEKTHPHVLPHLSKVKSPQALMGTMLKSVISRKLGIPPHRIWHLAVMPCFDKKLEASRGELTNTSWAANGEAITGAPVRDVDCVITSKEILMLTDSRRLDFFSLSRNMVHQQQPSFPDPTIQEFLFHRGKRPRASSAAGTSGGQVYHILEDVRARHADSRIVTTRGRNADVVEYTVEAATGEPIFRAARYYGFRNIQNLVRRLKPARQSRMPGARPIGAARKAAATKNPSTEYAYVEVMACPGGCTNGGGQLKVDDQAILDRKGFTTRPGPQAQKDWLAEVDEAYFSGDDPEGNGQSVQSDSSDADGRAGALDMDENPAAGVRQILAHWSGITGIDLHKLTYTSYREVISDVGKPRTTDTERVVQLAGKIGGGW